MVQWIEENRGSVKYNISWWSKPLGKWFGYRIVESVYFNNTDLIDYSPLIKLKSLKWFHIRGGALKDLSFMKELSNLERIHLESVGVTDITPLEGLTKLRRLGLNSVPVTMSAIDSIKRIKSPYIEYLEISSFYIKRQSVAEFEKELPKYHPNCKVILR